MRVSTVVHGPQRMNPNDLSDRLTFPPGPLSHLWCEISQQLSDGLCFLQEGTQASDRSSRLHFSTCKRDPTGYLKETVNISSHGNQNRYLLFQILSMIFVSNSNHSIIKMLSQHKGKLDLKKRRVATLHIANICGLPEL